MRQITVQHTKLRGKGEDTQKLKCL